MSSTRTTFSAKSLIGDEVVKEKGAKPGKPEENMIDLNDGRAAHDRYDRS